MNLIPLFLVSMAAVGYETALIRYFAVSKWSEYGYWVISIVMVGFALSGVLLAVCRDAFARWGDRLLAVLPPILVATAAGGFFLTAINPFNPLQLQNSATWVSQLWFIAAYYVVLLPFFFATGVFISLTFVLYAARIGLVYGFDLAGAAAGAASVLVLMFVLHPFDLVPALLLPLAASALLQTGRWRGWSILSTLLVLAVAESALLLWQPAEISDFKAIYAPLHTSEAAVIAEVRSPRGDYILLDGFTERVDTDISSNAGMMAIDGPPRGYGLYRDGNRITTLPHTGSLDAPYTAASLSAAPYYLIPHARVLLIGASGGFRIVEAKRLGASQVRVLEPEPLLARALTQGLVSSPAYPVDGLVRITDMSPIEATRRGVYDVIDLSADFLDAADANVAAFTAEAVAGYTQVLAPGGILSIPVSIRDFPVYALRMLATVRAALLSRGVADPSRHVVVYRSAWSVRILVSLVTWSPERIAAIRAFCEQRSFDLSWYPGMDVAAARDSIFNDLPVISFELGTVESTGPADAVADEAEAVLTGRDTPSSLVFNLAPVTLDRPFFYSVLRLDHLGVILKRLEILPQAEVGVLVNLAVLGQAAVIAVLVLLVPMAAPRRLRSPTTSLARAALYFPALGLGFLFIEIYAIEKASFWLTDRTTGFAVVLTAMLLFSGLGSMLVDRLREPPQRVLAKSVVAIIVWLAAVYFAWEWLIIATFGLPAMIRIALLILILAPVSLALGMPFPLGLSRAGDSGALPWAWGLNGAFSVVATPLANLIAREQGLSRVLFCAAILYGVALILFPSKRTQPAWQPQPV